MTTAGMTTTDVLKALADETRLRMVSLLAESDDLCGCELEAVLKLQQSNASRHLSRLRSAGVVGALKSGQWVHYTLSPPQAYAEVIRRVIETARSEDERFMRDLRRMHDYRESPFTCRNIWEWVELQDGESGTDRSPQKATGYRLF